jgi:N-acetylated-alpha-linked acidic dipeptidase
LVDISKATPENRTELRTRADLRIGALGSGSDYTVFIDHLGIPSVNLGYGGEDLGGGQYHSVYDDFYWYTHFEDTDFSYGRALAQTSSTLVLRLADADVIPFQYADAADTIHTYVAEVKKLAETQRAQIKERNAQIAEGVYKALEDPKKKSVAPPTEALGPYFNFAPLDQAADDLAAAAKEFDAAFAAHAAEGKGTVNSQLLLAERALVDPEGLPGRPWFQNLIYAPGLYTGYGVKTLPAVREAIEQKQWSEVDKQIARTAAAIERETDALKQATQTLNRQ